MTTNPPRLVGLWYWHPMRRAFVPLRVGSWYYDTDADAWLCVDAYAGPDEWARRLEAVAHAEKHVKYAVNAWDAEKKWRKGHEND